MDIKLNKIKLKNFKGIKEYSFEPDGEDVTLYGDNGTFKTTLADSWPWLLTGDDSRHEGKFEIKELDGNNNPILGQEHEVEAFLDIDEKPLILKKILVEEWGKRKGVKGKVVTGHHIDYFVDTVGCRKKDYQKKLDSLCPPEVLHSIIQPGFFSTLSTEKSRSILLDICRDIEFDDIIAENKKLSPLPDLIKSHTVEDFKKIVKAKKTKAKEKLAGIPDRIDENLLKKPDVEGLEETDVKKDIKSFTTKKKEAEILLASDDSTLQYKQKKTELELELLEIEKEFDKVKRNNIDLFRQDRDILIVSNSDVSQKIFGDEESARRKKTEIKFFKKRMNTLRTDWQKQHVLNFLETHCMACGQELKNEALKTAKESFNQNKAEKLKQINNEGMAIKNDKEVLEADCVKLEKEISELNKELESGQKKIKKVREDIKKVENEKIINDEDYQEVQEKINDLDEPESTTDEAALKEKITEYDENIFALNNTLQQFETVKTIDERDKELKKQGEEFAKQIETAEYEISLCDLFTRTKTAMLESGVNKYFKLTTFKMFRERVNGELEDVCIAMFQGIPYDKNLNSGHKRQVDLDIINTLSEYYSVYMPVFVDNMESVTELPVMDTQVIKLIKPEIIEKNKKYYSKLITEKWVDPESKAAKLKAFRKELSNLTGEK